VDMRVNETGEDEGPRPGVRGPRPDWADG
jgi:hypothetical protein